MVLGHRSLLATRRFLPLIFLANKLFWILIAFGHSSLCLFMTFAHSSPLPTYHFWPLIVFRRSTLLVTHLFGHSSLKATHCVLPLITFGRHWALLATHMFGPLITSARSWPLISFGQSSPRIMHLFWALIVFLLVTPLIQVLINLALHCLWACIAFGHSSLLAPLLYEHIELPAKLLDYFLRSNEATSIKLATHRFWTLISFGHSLATHLFLPPIVFEN